MSLRYLLLTSVYIVALWASPVYSAERIISLKPNITEILLQLGLGDQLTGVTTFCQYPDSLGSIDKVADYVHVDVEKVLVLKPTLIIGSKENSIKKEVEFLEKQGLNVHLFPFERLSDTYSSIEKISSLVGKKTQGQNIVQKMNDELQQLQKGLNFKGTAKLLAVIDSKPLVVVGSHNILNDLFELLGVENVAGKSKLRYPSYSLEKLIASQPEIIVDLSISHDLNALSQNRKLVWYSQYASIPAVQKKQVYFLDVGDFLASPQLIRGAKKLAAVLTKVALPSPQPSP